MFGSGLRWDSATQHVKNEKKPNTYLVSRAVQEQIWPVVFSEKDGGVRPQYLMVNGLTGKMGRAVAEAASHVAGLELVPHSLCSRHRSGDERYLRIGEVNVEIHPSSEKDAVLDTVAQEFPGVIVVDYTVPASVNVNAKAYCKRQLPFVMGTNGAYDRAKLLDRLIDAGSYAVIAPNMGKPNVALQAVLEIMAIQFPWAFDDCTLKVTMSNLSDELDPSGTVIAVLQSFNKLGIDFDRIQFKRIRERAERINWGIPEEHLNGHAFHTYSVTSDKDQSVNLKFEHNICGREIYAEGTIDAVLFLAKQIREKAAQKIYNLLDVMREGNMR